MAENPQSVAMITGGNSGIGFATVSKLAEKGFLVLLASRNQKTSAQAIKCIQTLRDKDHLMISYFKRRVIHYMF